jgi:hypothetical protein
LDISERPDGTWEVTIKLGASPTTLFANATTRDAAIEHASRTILPAVLLTLFRRAWSERPKGQPLFAGTSRLATVKRTMAEHFGGFGVTLRFREEPDGSYSWGVFDERTGEGLSSGVEDAFDNAKFEALMKLVPPSREP